MAAAMLEILRMFLFDMSPDVLIVKVRVLTSDFIFWIGVNEY